MKTEKEINLIVDRAYSKWKRDVAIFKAHDSEKTYKDVSDSYEEYCNVCKAYHTWVAIGEWVL